jgi:hypothetical protein
MAKRKTVEVTTLVENANRLLALPDAHGRVIDLNADFRRGVISMVERVLHDTGNYRGFAYLSSELTTADQPHTPNTTYLRIGYDETRRRYY